MSRTCYVVKEHDRATPLLSPTRTIETVQRILKKTLRMEQELTYFRNWNITIRAEKT